MKIKPHKEQYNFNNNVFEQLNCALELVGEYSECAEMIRDGMNLTNDGSKHLTITDGLGWERAKSYQLDPFAENFSDEKSLKRLHKEGKLGKEESAKLAKDEKIQRELFHIFLSALSRELQASRRVVGDGTERGTSPVEYPFRYKAILQQPI